MPGVRAIEQLIELFGRLPGIGRRTSRRLVFFLLETEPEYCAGLGDAIMSLRDRVRSCSICGNLTEEELCSICMDPMRDERQLCVVTSVADLLALEAAGTFRGRYHTLGGLLSPLDGVGPEDLKIDSLLRRIDASEAVEVILATPPNVEGEATAAYLAELIRPKVGRVSRIASGIPHGGDLELFDPVTLGRALEGRRDMNS